MNARFARAIALAGLALAAPVPADATVFFHVVYDAVITDGSDADNIFGLATKNLAGLGLRADVTYSTSVPGTRTTTATDDEVMGGEAFGTDPVISSAIFTIGARSYSLFPSYYDDVYTSAGYMDTYGYDSLGNGFQIFIVPARTGPANLQTLFSSAGTGDPGGASTQYSFVSIGGDLIDFDTTAVTMSAVPEPGAWATMLVGLGVVGGTMRRRTKRLVPACA